MKCILYSEKLTYDLTLSQTTKTSAGRFRVVVPFDGEVETRPENEKEAGNPDKNTLLEAVGEVGRCCVECKRVTLQNVYT